MIEVIQDVVAGQSEARKVYALFNKSTGAYYTWASWHEPHGFDTTLFNIVTIERFDSSKEVILGSWGDWKIAPIANQPIMVTEEHLDALTEEAILSTFSLGRQINTVAEALVELARAAGLSESPAIVALTEQVDQIKLMLTTGDLRKMGYASDDSFQYVSDADAVAEETLRSGGGVYAQAGPRQIV